MKRIIIEEEEYYFKPAERSDAGEILSLYKSVMGTEGCTWDETYPSTETIEKDFSNDALFVLKDKEEKIAGAISIDEDTEVNALTCWSEQLEPAAELARLVIREDMQNHGLALIMIKNTMEELKQRGIKGVHFLVSKTNEKAIRSYRKLNFTKCGESDLYGENWWCYEKAL